MVERKAVFFNADEVAHFDEVRQKGLTLEEFIGFVKRAYLDRCLKLKQEVLSNDKKAKEVHAEPSAD